MAHVIYMIQSASETSGSIVLGIIVGKVQNGTTVLSDVADQHTECSYKLFHDKYAFI